MWAYHHAHSIFYAWENKENLHELLLGLKASPCYLSTAQYT